jgi:hypothetical protein
MWPVRLARKFLRGIVEFAQKAAYGSFKGKDSRDLNEPEVFQREQATNRGQGDGPGGLYDARLYGG